MMNQTLSKPQTVEQLDAKAGCPVLLCSAADVDPRKNPAFSPNLFKWLKKNPRMIERADRYEHEGMEYIGYLEDGYLIGSRLWTVLCNGASATRFAYLGMAREAALRPMWADYLLRGRCAIDPQHAQVFQDDRFTVSGDLRTCDWCGHTQRRERYQVVLDRERWISEPNTHSGARVS